MIRTKWKRLIALLLTGTLLLGMPATDAEVFYSDWTKVEVEEYEFSFADVGDYVLLPYLLTINGIYFGSILDTTVDSDAVELDDDLYLTAVDYFDEVTLVVETDLGEYIFSLRNPGAAEPIPVGTEVMGENGSFVADGEVPAGTELTVSSYTPTEEQATAVEGEHVSWFDIGLVADGEQVEAGATVIVNVDIPLPVAEEKPGLVGRAVLRDVKLYHLVDGEVEELDVEAESTDTAITSLTFTTASFSPFAVSYTVDFVYEGAQFSIAGESGISVSELLSRLGLEVGEVETVTFSDPDLISVEQTEDDWLLTSLQPFSSQETLTLTLADGSVVLIGVTDAQYTTDLSVLFNGLTIEKNGELCDLNSPIIVREGDSFVLDLSFAEHDEYQFMNDDTVMYFAMPEEFKMDEGFETTTDVAITVGGKVHVLKNNRVTYDPENHRVCLQWNTTDPEFAYLVQSGDANVEFRVTGSFDRDENKQVQFSDSVTVETAPPANAGVEKIGEYDATTGIITYTLSVRAEGDVTGDITLTDAFIGGSKSALSYVDGSVSVSWNEGTTRTAEETEAIKNSWTKEDTSFTITIPKGNGRISLANGEVCVVTYQAKVDKNKLNLSSDTAYSEDGEPIQQVFDDTGNTVTLSNPENRYDEPRDNVSTWVEPIQFSDMHKDGVLGPATNGEDAQGKEIRYRDVTWTVTTNSKAENSLGGSTITDTLTWNPEFIAMQLQPLTGNDAGILVQRYTVQGEETTPVGEGEYIPWTDLNITRGSDAEADGTPLSTMTWTWNVPDTDPYKYVITYITRADLADVKAGSTVFNDVYGKGGHDDVEVTIWPVGRGDNISVDKTVVSNSLSEIQWNMDVYACIPAYDDYFRVTDTVPSQWVVNPETGVGERLKDTLKGLEYGVVYEANDPLLDGVIEIDGLQEGETWTAEWVDGGRYDADKLLIRFYKDGEEGLVEGLKEYTGEDIEYVTVTLEDGTKETRQRRLINIKLTTQNNETWVDWATRSMATKAWQAYHENKVQVRGDTGHYDFDSARAPIVKPSLIKSLSTDANYSTPYQPVLYRITGKVDGIEYPAYRFLTTVGGIRDDNNTVHQDENGSYILVRDTFDTSIWKLFKDSDFSLGWYTWMNDRAFSATTPGYPNPDVATEIESGYECTATETGVEFRIYNPPKKADGSYENFYTFMYWLVPKDQEAMEAVIADTLKEENKQVLAHVTKGVATYNNSAELILTEGEPLEDDADYVYEYNPTSKSVFYDDVNRIATYTVVLNAQKANLVADTEGDQTLEMTDEHSANLSVDYSTIRIYIDDETEPDTQNRVTYDYSGNVGTFKIPDETKVTITYEAKLIATSGSTVNFENTVTMNGFKTTVSETKKITSESSSSAGVYQLNLFKYSSGNMQSGLQGATFRLLDANKRPILDRDKREITFTTGGDGYATITLHEHEQGVSLKKNTTYYLQEIKAPIVEEDGDVTYYRQDPTYYSFLISDNPNYSAPGGVYVYSNGDILKVRNFEDKGGLNISKSFAGNVNLTDAQKQQITFRVEKQTASGAWSLVKEIPYTDFTYSDYEDQNGKRITGTYHYSMDGLEVGDVYRVIEHNADINVEDVTLSTEYLVDGRTSDNGQFTIVPTDVVDTNKSSHNVIVTNTYYKPSYTFTKRDAESGAALAGAVFTVFSGEDEIRTYTTGADGTIEITEKDGYQKGTLYYAVETAAPAGYVLPDAPEKFYFYFGGEVVVPEGISAVNLGEDYGTAFVANEKQLVDVPVMKTWGKSENQVWPEAAVQYIRIGLYQKEAGADAEPVPVMVEEEPVTMVLTAADVIGEGQYGKIEFTNLPAASDAGKLLEYSIKEIAISFDGETEVEPEDSFTVTYKDEGEYKAVNNTDKGTTLSVNKVWYAKDETGNITSIDPTGDEYTRTFHIYRNAMTGAMSESQTRIPVRTNSAEYIDITPGSDLFLEPGDVVAITAEIIDTSKKFNFAVRYTSSEKGGWLDFDPVISHWFDPWHTTPYSYVFTIPTDIHFTGIIFCNFEPVHSGQVTVKKVKSGSTLSGHISHTDQGAYTSETEEVAQFTLPNGGWTYTSDLLEKYDENGIEYTYWISEDNADADTTYLYRNGDVTVSNTMKTTSINVTKQWSDSQNRHEGILVDLYRTTTPVSGATASTTFSVDFPMTSAYGIDIQESYEYHKGDKIKISIESFAENKEKSGTWNYNIQVAVKDGVFNKWGTITGQEGNVIQEYIPWETANKTYDLIFELTDDQFKDLQNSHKLYINGNYPQGKEPQNQSCRVSIIEGTLAELTQDALSQYIENAEVIKSGIVLNDSNGWAFDSDTLGMTLPKYSDDGQTEYQYFAVERSVDGYDASYSLLGNNTAITNTTGEEVKHGNLTISKEVVGGPASAANRSYYFTVSRNGYYYRADGSYSTSPVEIEVANGGTVTLSNLPVGTYTIAEILKGEHGAEIPGYKLTTELVGGATVADGTNTTATLKNTYEPGVEQTTLKVKKNWIPAATGDTSATFTLKRFMNDGVTPDEIAWNEAQYTAVLDGETDEREMTAWEYTWPEVDKVYWDSTKGEYVDYVYKIEETSVTYNGITTDSPSDSGAWNVTVENSDNGWEVTNTRNSTTLEISKQWVGANGEAMTWPEGVPITVTVSKSLNVPGLGLRPSTEKVTFTLLPDNTKLASLNSSTGCAVSVEKVGEFYKFTIDGLQETGEITISGRKVTGTWVYSFTETKLDGFDAPEYEDGTVTNKQQPVKAALSVTKAVTLADGQTPYTGSWPDEGFTFTLENAEQAGVAKTATANEAAKTAQFDEIEFTKAGIYTFTIKESNGHAANYTYDTATHTVEVKVVEVNGKLTVESIKYDDDTALTITNKYAEPGEVLFRVKKIYAGGQFSDAEPFTFTLAQVTGENSTAAAPDGVNQTITTTGKTGSTAELAFDPVTLENGTYWFMIEEQAGANANIQYDGNKHWVKVEVENGEVKKNGETYDPSGIDASFTNTLLTSQTATKKWVEADGKTAFTPASGTTISLQLTQWRKDGTQVDAFSVQSVVLDGSVDDSAADLGAGISGQEGSNWTYTWNNLPKVYEYEGTYLEYEYQVIESAVANGITADGKYLVTVDGMTVTNRKNEKTVEFGKQWRDGGGLNMDWPMEMSITVHLKRTGDNAYDKQLTLNPATTSVIIDDIAHAVTWKLPEDGDARKIYWFAIEGLDKIGSDGTEWAYYVVEDAVTGYLTSYSNESDRAGEQQYIINRDATANLQVTKEWQDKDGNRLHTWPAGTSLTLQVHRVGEEDPVLTLTGVKPGWSNTTTVNGQTVTASMSSDFTLNIQGLPAADIQGNVYQYYVTETPVAGYKSPEYGNSGEYIGQTGGAFHKGVIKNEKTPGDESGTVTIPVKKTLQGRNMQEGEFSFALRPIDIDGIRGEKKTIHNPAANAGQEVTFNFTLNYSSSSTAPYRDEAGNAVYFYVVYEEEGTAGGVTYDNHQYVVKVTITESGSATTEYFNYSGSGPLPSEAITNLVTPAATYLARNNNTGGLR